MSTVTDEYTRTLPEIYRDILNAFPLIEPARASGDGLTYQSIYVHLREKWSLDEIIKACEKMKEGGAVELRMRLFVCPTPLGESIIASLTGKKPSERQVPAFPVPKG
jgi:hypothetical protein